MLNGRSREMGLGSLKAVSLAKAREKAEICRSLKADGVDPIQARDADQKKSIASADKSIAFEEAANAYIAAHEAGWKSAKHASQWRNTLAAHAYPVAERLLVSDIDTEVVMQILQPIWSLKPETAGRLRGRIERILDWATVSGFRQGQTRLNGGGTLRTCFRLNHVFTTSNITRQCPTSKYRIFYPGCTNGME